ncbi:MAG: 3',5'-cyclic adenosine monophosphate phosphodiesterase CpdA [Anaerolineae bacterium]|nr:3',5'-cyclic adenosine monophosphate phosphodiesterase CpdA [Anaerolineae bacterium]
MSHPINLLHLADIHIGIENYGRLDAGSGLNSRVVDFLRRLSQAIDIALDREVDVCIFAGDAYKNQRPNPTYQREFARRIKRLADHGVPVILLIGNHDMATADRAASSLDIFGVLDVPGVIVAGREELHQITCRRGQPLQVATAPYPQRSRLLAYDQFRNMTLDDLDMELGRIMDENLRDMAAQAQDRPDIPTVLAGHFSVSGAVQGSEQSVMIGRDVVVMKSLLADPAWDYVALGHIHKHQELNGGQHPPIVYPGSLERIDFGEEKERKGFVMVQLERGRANWEFIPVDARRFVTIRMDVTAADDPMTQILDELEAHNLDEAVVRIIIKATEAQDVLLDDKLIREALRPASTIASIIHDVERQHRHRLGAGATEELTPKEALELYLEAKNTPETRKTELLRYAESIFREE